jgi:hypothetical protein
VHFKDGMWPINCKIALEKIKMYAPLESLEPELPTIPQTPTRFVYAKYGLTHWTAKIKEKLSSPSCDGSVNERTVRCASAAKPIRLSSLYNKNLKLKKEEC